MSRFRKLIQLLNKKEKINLTILLFSIIIMGLFELASVGSILPFLQVASNPELINESGYIKTIYELFSFQEFQSFIIFLGCCSLFIIVSSNIIKAFVIYGIQRYTALRHHHVSERLYKRFLSQPYAFFLNINSADITKNILNDVGIVIGGTLFNFLEAISQFVLIVFLTALLIFINPWISLFALFFFGLVYSLFYFFIRKFLNKTGNEQTVFHQARFRLITDSFNGIKEVLLSGNEEYFLNRFSKVSRNLAMNNANHDTLGSLPRFIMEILAFGGVILLFLIYMARDAELQQILPLLSVFAFTGYKLIPSFQKIFKSLTRVKYNSPMIDLVHDLIMNMEIKKHIEKPTETEKIMLYEKINLNNLEYIYPETTDPVVKIKKMVIKKDTTVALVGPTGCGKTTLASLLLGLLNPVSGDLQIDEKILDENNIRNWQKNIGFVPQNLFILDDTIIQNIAFTIEEEKIDIERVKKAASMACIDKFIETELEHKYETVVGERGTRLSGGQIQRIGIARALYHDPQVLILDEATSALDNNTEKQIMDSIFKLTEQKTIIMIAHRLSTIQNCDEIFYLEKGKIIDSGSFESLIQTCIPFKKQANIK